MSSALKIKPLSTTGIGSLPHLEPERAVLMVLEHFDIPFWPQLPALGFRELMVPQYSEGMPGVRLDAEAGKIWLERDGAGIAKFYEEAVEGFLSPISPDYAQGLYAFKEKNISREMVKGHVTGPLTFTLGLNDADGRAVYFDEELREIALMLLCAKARWQVRELLALAKEVIIFIDEPILSALGTPGYAGVSNDEALRLLNGLSGAIVEAGGIPGIHCCGRADWPLAYASGAKIMNFDSFDFGGTLSIYPAELNEFLGGGGILAWGAVPTLQALGDMTVGDILAQFKKTLDKLSESVPRELLLSNIMLTPACGTGTRTEEETTKVFELLGGLKGALQSNG